MLPVWTKKQELSGDAPDYQDQIVVAEAPSFRLRSYGDLGLSDVRQPLDYPDHTM